MAKPKIISDFKPDFTRIKRYDRKYINLPYDTVRDIEFLKLKPSVHKFYIVLGFLSFERADSEGWFLATTHELMDLTNLSKKTIQEIKKILVKKHFLDVGIGFRKDSIASCSDCFRINGFKDMSVSEG